MPEPAVADVKTVGDAVERRHRAVAAVDGKYKRCARRVITLRSAASILS